MGVFDLYLLKIVSPHDLVYLSPQVKLFSPVWPGMLQSCNDDIYLPQNFGSLKSMEGLPLTTLCVQVSDPTGINDGTLCSLSITTI